MVTQSDLEHAIRSRIDRVSSLIVSDVSGGCGQAYDVVIVSDVFEGLTTLKRHRMVNELLKDEIAQLHAFSQKTFTPKQYEELSKSSDAAPPAPASSSSSSTQAPPPIVTPASSTLSPKPSKNTLLGLGAPLTPTRSGSKSHHRSTSSVSIPELTLTTDTDAPFSPAGGVHASPGGGVLPDMAPPLASPHSPNVSNLHFHKVQSVEFWSGLRDYLESQFLAPSTPSGGTNEASNPLAATGSAAPSTPGGAPAAAAPASPSMTSRRTRGEAEVAEIWDTFLGTQKRHLSANDIARIRDGVGLYGQGGV